MSDALYSLPITRLFTWILEEEKSGQMFGISNELFYTPSQDDPFRMRRYGRLLETPIGVAAGPHTQMSQNIITAWLLGARYIELKTVQTLDAIHVPRPCIDMQDEGYNVEWSQELSLDQSFHEYLNAWIVLHTLRHHWGWRHQDDPGFIFNMSIGYDLKGILKPNVQRFLSRMSNCRAEKERKLEALAAIYPGVREVGIPDQISDNVTLSTMHGCPPDEVESIGRYLMEKMGLHTTIKLNPTLLGKDYLTDLLNEKLGYKTQVPDQAFANDLHYEEAVRIIRNLRQVAAGSGVSFGLKLTNTLQSLNTGDVLPETESMMYMSGRALHPIAVHLAQRLQNEFNGELDISFSGGADAFNVAELIGANLSPVTVCTDLLKPGGYTRLPQYLEQLERAFGEVNARSIPQFILAKSGSLQNDVRQAALDNLRNYAEHVAKNRFYRKDYLPDKSIKSDRPLSQFDCIHAPCVDACATHQEVPDYMYYTSRGQTEEALQAILATNPFPNATGLACDHLCQTRCTRLNYDEPVLIREIKRYVAEHASGSLGLSPAGANGLRVAIIGAGPSGLSCAYFLALRGFEVNVYEATKRPGGMLAHTIPGFRLPDDALQRDVERIERMGVNIHYGWPIDSPFFAELRQRNDYIYIAIGAQQGRRLDIPGEESPHVMDALEFLANVRKDQNVSIGHRVAVVGGGNTAIDAARTARRLVGESGEITIYYRRTRHEMPADEEEIQAALDEGITVIELVAPKNIITRDGYVDLVCQRVRLGEKDASGRKRPIRIPDSEFTTSFDTIITAVGQRVVLDFLGQEALRADPVTRETGIPNVYIGGDAMRGSSTLILAIADGKEAAESILKAAGHEHHFRAGHANKGLTLADFQKRAARRIFAAPPEELPPHNRFDFRVVTKTLSDPEARKEADRCLYCNDICNVCVGVCPNRANISYTIRPVEYKLSRMVPEGGEVWIEDHVIFRMQQSYQVLNVADLCNECGNCTTFCPTSGAPFRDKPRLCLTEESFASEAKGLFVGVSDRGPFIQFKNGERVEKMTIVGQQYILETEAYTIKLSRKDFSIADFIPETRQIGEITLIRAAEISVLLEALANSYLMRVLEMREG